MEIYRVHYRGTFLVGPYSDEFTNQDGDILGWYLFIHSSSQDDNHPSPEEDKMGRFRRNEMKRYFFGFDSIESLFNWFDPIIEAAKVDDVTIPDLVVSRITFDDDNVIHGNAQVAFDPDFAIKVEECIDSFESMYA